MYFGVILSPCSGTVEKITVKNDVQIYEWEALFTIKTDGGRVEEVQTGVNGEIESLEVQEGDYVIPGMVLAYIKEELFE
jgi:biotin carboxyl carrier protein